MDISKMPEFILGFTTLCYIVSIAMIEAFKPKSVVPPKLEGFGKSIDYYTVCLLSLFIVVCIFFLINIKRTFWRKKANLTSKVYFYLTDKHVGIFEIFGLCLYICLFCCGLIGFWITLSY